MLQQRTWTSLSLLTYVLSLPVSPPTVYISLYPLHVSIFLKYSKRLYKFMSPTVSWEKLSPCTLLKIIYLFRVKDILEFTFHIPSFREGVLFFCFVLWLAAVFEMLVTACWKADPGFSDFFLSFLPLTWEQIIGEPCQ